jgi:hypothetical protein
VIAALELPFRFDAVRLRADLAAVTPDDWSPHYNAADYGGLWRGAALRSRSGSARELAAQSSTFQDTPLLDRCAYFREALAAFECPVKSARLLALAPGSFIREHTDDALDFEDGEVRLHLPIATNPEVEFYVADDRLLLEPGAAYYVNVNLPHRVSNRGATERIHLVIDAEVNDWLREVFRRSSAIPRIAPPPRGVDAFRDAVLAAPHLREALGAIEDSAAFPAAAVRLGRDAGFDFHENDADALLRGRARPGPAGGLPIAAHLSAGGAALEWIDADPPLAEPFFEDTVRLCLRKPYARFSRRVAPLVTSDAAPAPCGLIFHVSRCGSTLAGRMLAAAGCRVLSESAAMDAVIQAGHAGWIRSTAAALGAGKRYILKLDAWHVHALPLLRAAFPDTPWVFLYRDPVEVLASHARSPGRHMLPGALDARAVGMSPEDITAIPRAEWPARVLARLCEAALRHRDGLFVDYRDLPGDVGERVVPHFGLTLDDAARARMREASRFDAKRPTSEFASDTAAKQTEGAGLRTPILEGLYRELRRVTSAQAGADAAPDRMTASTPTPA